MQIATQESISELKAKYGQEFDRFLDIQKHNLESEFRGWRLKNWLADCFVEIDKNDDVTTRVCVNGVTFAGLFRYWQDESFVPVTQLEILKAGIYGKIWTADVIINNDILDGYVRLESGKGISREFMKPF